MDKCPLSLGMSAAGLGRDLDTNPFCDSCVHEKIKWTQGWKLGKIRVDVQEGRITDSEAFERTFEIMGD